MTDAKKKLIVLQKGKKMKKPKRKMRHYKSRGNHHLTPKIRGGGGEASNLLLLKTERHEHWHKIFGNRTLKEVILVLIRLKQMKAGKMEVTHGYN